MHLQHQPIRGVANRLGKVKVPHHTCISLHVIQNIRMCFNIMSSYSAFFAVVDSQLLPSLLRCGRPPLHQDPTPPPPPLHTPSRARHRLRSRCLLLSVVFRTCQLAVPISLLRPHCLTGNPRRASLGMGRPQPQQVCCSTNLMCAVGLTDTLSASVKSICTCREWVSCCERCMLYCINMWYTTNVYVRHRCGHPARCAPKGVCRCRT